jgi:serine/threonine protein phosphatase PrpC
MPDDSAVFDLAIPGPAALPPIELSILSRRGGREQNEDACGHWHSERHLCCVVADGAGGHGGGDIASRLAVRHVIEQFAAAPLDTADEVADLLRDTNAALLRHQGAGGVQRDMRSTVVALFIDLGAGQALWGHAGDSRLYLFREGLMVSRTHDHSVVQSLVEAGLLDPDQAHTHPQRSELLSALGTDPEHLRVTAARPWTLRAGDVFLLCTDGLWDHVDEADMSTSLAGAASASDWLARLEKLVLRHVVERGAVHHDNFSGIAAWIGASPS